MITCQIATGSRLSHADELICRCQPCRANYCAIFTAAGFPGRRELPGTLVDPSIYGCWPRPLVTPLAFTLILSITTMVPYANSLDPDETPGNPASYPDRSY